MNKPAPLPEGTLVGWYGDDFTGAAAVMEVLSFAGYPSVLFLDVPTEAQRARFATMRGIGIAGTARARTPEWMREHLPRAFAFLDTLDVPVLHYKVCSTLDSSPGIGSIGCAIDSAQEQLESAWVPVLIAAPAIRRYQAFGHLFAAAGDGVYRLDRHPVMSRHPSTPMDESDVLRHLSKQTERPVALIDLEMLRGEAGKDATQRLADLMGSAGSAGSNHTNTPTIVALDTVDDATLHAAGRLIWEQRGKRVFAVGSQGVEYALVRYWQDAPNAPTVAATEPPVERLIVLSGSVSAITAGQIEHALQRGAEPIAIDPALAFSDRYTQSRMIDELVQQALHAIEQQQDPILFTARGPDDPAVAAFNDACAAHALPAVEANRRLGVALGELLSRLLEQSGLRRAVVCGGDTSGHVTQALDVYALTALAPIVAGGSLLEAHSYNASMDLLELSLKGGQMGPPDYFQRIKNGGLAAYNGDQLR